jgi:urease accessory protein UreF
MHPAFFGSFDWHSSVHGHWMLVRLLRLYPDMTNAPEIRARLAAHLTATNLAVEAAYFDAKENRSFERMYGWAWALRLTAELRSWDDPDARQWAKNIAPLEQKLVALTKDYLPRLTYPVRTGVHPDTAFALAQIIDYARTTGNPELEQLAVVRAKNYFVNDKNYPADYEPSGEDFFSPGLNVADLMRRVLSREEFSTWLDAYLPGLRAGKIGAWNSAAEVSDLTDARIIHLVGLNLARAWTMRGVASGLPPADSRRQVLDAVAKLQADAGLKYVFSGNYEGEHWLATFAVYLLTNAGTQNQR